MEKINSRTLSSNGSLGVSLGWEAERKNEFSGIASRQ